MPCVCIVRTISLVILADGSVSPQKLVCNAKQLGPAPNAVLLSNRKVISHVLMWLDSGEWRKLPTTGLAPKAPQPRRCV